MVDMRDSLNLFLLRASITEQLEATHVPASRAKPGSVHIQVVLAAVWHSELGRVSAMQSSWFGDTRSASCLRSRGHVAKGEMGIHHR